VRRKLKPSPLYQRLTNYTEYILHWRITRRTTKICQLSRQNRSVNSSHSQLVTCDELVMWRVDWQLYGSNTTQISAKYDALHFTLAV